MKVSKKKRITKKYNTKKYNTIIKGGGNIIINKSLQKPLTPLEKFEETCDYDNDNHSHGHSKIKIPFYCYGKKIYELTNQSIGIQYNENRYDYYTITPLTLSVPTMQLAVDSRSLSIIEEDGTYYLGFTNNFPSLMVQQTYNYAYTTRPLDTNETEEFDESKPKAKWFSVYEDKDTFIYKDKKFEIIEDYKASNNYVIYNPETTDNPDSHTFNQSRLNSSANKSFRPHYLNGGSLSRPRTRHSSKKKSSKNIKNKSLNTLIRKIFGNEKTIYITTDSNLKSFEYLTEQVRHIIEEIKKEKKNSEIDTLLFKRKLAISRVIYRTYINFNGQTGNIIENIRWVVENALWLEKYVELKKQYGEVNNLLTNPNYKELQHPMYESDFSGLDSKYIIMDNDDTTQPDYVICGYPERQMKAHILNFWQTTENPTKFTTLFKALDTDNANVIAKLFNEFKEEKDKIKDKTEYYKLYMSLRKSIFKYIEDRYTELNKEDKTKVSDVELQHFKDHFEKNAEHYFQQIALKYLPKPMVFIKYVFLVFNKHKDGKLTPMVFNVKELTKQHQSILERVERLIKHELPYKFGILNDAEYKNKNENKTDPFDDEYKLFYSRYRYGKFFHISTEYVHTMSNISDKAHGYKNSITLEELIYSCGLLSDSGKPFFEDVKLDYEVREHQINKYSISQSEHLNTKKYSHLNKELTTGLRSEEVFDLYEKEKSKKNNNSKNIQSMSKNKQYVKLPIKQYEIKQMKFILMSKLNIQEYTFIYLLNSKFYKLIIKSNTTQILKEIIEELKDNKISNNFNNIVIKFNNVNKCFKIISNDILSLEDYKNLFEINPIIIKIFTKPNIINNKINTYYYYSTDLLDIKKIQNYNDNMMVNLYDTSIHIPIVLQNYLKTYSNKYNTKTIMYNNNSKHFSDCVKNKDCINITNYIHLNQNKCGYDFIESIDHKQGKITVYIYPSSNQKKKYLGNYMDLDKSSIPMLKALIDLYLYNNDYIIFLHKTITIWFYCLHFHIIKKTEYKRETFSYNEKGSYYIQDITIHELINKLETNENYYINSKYSFIKAY